MSGDFFDSNIFVYLLDSVDTRKRNIAEALIGDAITHRTASGGGWRSW